MDKKLLYLRKFHDKKFFKVEFSINLMKKNFVWKFAIISASSHSCTQSKCSLMLTKYHLFFAFHHSISIAETKAPISIHSHLLPFPFHAHHLSKRLHKMRKWRSRKMVLKNVFMKPYQLPIHSHSFLSWAVLHISCSCFFCNEHLQIVNMINLLVLEEISRAFPSGLTSK